MLHHVSVGVSDVVRAGQFYDAVLKTLGYKRVADYSPGAIAYGESKDRPEFWVGLPHDRNAASVGNGTHVGFVARSKQAVNKFHEAALKAGASNNGEPGPRPDYGPAYYGAFVYDLDGNKIEATLSAPPKAAAAPKAKAKSARKPARKAKKTTAKRGKKKRAKGR
jgi:catechol 2,3-dioxygenase-like lactoylglutathione lyase family enzyme